MPLECICCHSYQLPSPESLSCGHELNKWNTLETRCIFSVVYCAETRCIVPNSRIRMHQGRTYPKECIVPELCKKLRVNSRTAGTVILTFLIFICAITLLNKKSPTGTWLFLRMSVFSFLKNLHRRQRKYDNFLPISAINGHIDHAKFCAILLLIYLIIHVGSWLLSNYHVKC